MALAREGVPGALTHVQEKEALKRQYFDRAISLISATVIPDVNGGITVSC